METNLIVKTKGIFKTLSFIIGSLDVLNLPLLYWNEKECRNKILIYSIVQFLLFDILYSISKTL